MKREKEILEKSLVILVREFAPKRIYLFGSRAKKEEQTPSDFDFALDCATPTMTEKRLAKELLEKVMGLYSFDLVFLSEVEQGFRKLILETGKIIYEQK